MPDAAAPTPSPFAPTRWSLVLRARGTQPEARAALAELCEAYWQPVFRFLRREGRDEDSARELTQEFFARLLARPGLGAVDPARGRFRSYLLGGVKHFLADVREHDARHKRGGGVPHESLDGLRSGGDNDEVPREFADPAGPPADAGFDREWAVAVMARAVGLLEDEYTKGGKAALFAVLKEWLAGDPPRPQTQAARDLGLTEGAFKVAVHRLRKRFRDWIHLELAQTLPEGADTQEELHYLIEVLSRSDAPVTPPTSAAAGGPVAPPDSSLSALSDPSPPT